MGLLLSVLVVCVGVLEAISCVTHVRHGFLPVWGVGPTVREHSRRKPNEDDSSEDESSDELSRILNLGRDEALCSPSRYGLTPILTEHRRNTPILRDGDDDYVANNIDECCTGTRDIALTERFRPISPSDLEEPPLDDESYVSQTGKFLEVPPDGSPLQRSSSEETLHDSECEELRGCPRPEPGVDVFDVQVDRASPPRDDVTSDDPVYNLVRAAAHILSRSPLPLGATTSSCRPLNVDATARIPTPQTHRESIPFDLAAAHAHEPPRRARADISWPVFQPEPVIRRPALHLAARGDSIEEDLDLSLDWDLDPRSPTLEKDIALSDPRSPREKDIALSDPRSPREKDIALSDLALDPRSPREEDIALSPLDPHSPREDTSKIVASSLPTSHVGLEPSKVEVVEVEHANIDASNPDEGRSVEDQSSKVEASPLEKGRSLEDQCSKVEKGRSVEDQCSKVDASPLEKGRSVEDQCSKVDASPLEKGRSVEDQCSRVVARSLSATPFMSIPGSGRAVGAQPPRHVGDASTPRRKTSVDRFGRITCEPRRKRRGSLERAEGTLRDSVMSKSLPDFFFEERAVAKKEDDDDAAVSLGKDITPKESSIKRRRSYREKKRSSWTPSKSRTRDVTESVSEEKKKSLFEIDNESMEEAIINSALTPVEVLHHSEVRPESGVFATPTQQPKTRLKKPAKAESFEEAGPTGGHAHKEAVATPTRQPAKAESFEDAGPTGGHAHKDVIATPTPQPAKAESFEEAGPTGGHAHKEAVATPTPQPAKAESSEEAGPVARHAHGEPIETRATAPPAADDEPPPPLARPTREPASNTDETKANNTNDDDDDYDVSASESDTSNINQPQQSSEPAPFWVRRH